MATPSGFWKEELVVLGEFAEVPMTAVRSGRVFASGEIVSMSFCVDMRNVFIPP